MNVVAAGTFNTLHLGHKRFLGVALSLGRLFIGLTSDEFASKMRPSVKPFDDRKKFLEEFLASKNANAEIVKIDDIYGFAADREDIDAIVVTEETLDGAKRINTAREKKGLPPLVIVLVPLVKNERGEKLSARELT